MSGASDTLPSRPTTAWPASFREDTETSRSVGNRNSLKILTFPVQFLAEIRHSPVKLHLWACSISKAVRNFQGGLLAALDHSSLCTSKLGHGRSVMVASPRKLQPKLQTGPAPAFPHFLVEVLNSQ